MTIFDLERAKKILQDFRARVSIQLPKKDVFPFYPDRSFGDRGDVFTTIRWEKGVKRLDGRRKIAENSIFALAYCALIYDFHDTIAGGVTTITRRFAQDVVLIDSSERNRESPYLLVRVAVLQIALPRRGPGISVATLVPVDN